MKNKQISPLKIELENMPYDDMIYIRVQLEKEFKRRGIKFSAGDIGEKLAIEFFNNTPGFSNLQISQTGTRNVDANSRNGERYSIKTIKDGSKTGTIYPDKNNKDKECFEYILVVQLSDDYEMKSLHRFSWEQFVKVRQWDSTMNAWYIPKTQKALIQGEKLYEKK